MNPVADFSTYDSLCNANNKGSRRRGILSEVAYADIAADDETVLLDVGIQSVPLLIGIEHGLSMGYDPLKCRRLADGLAGDARIVAFPVHTLCGTERHAVGALLARFAPISLYFNDHGGDESDALRGVVDEFSLTHEEVALADPRAGAEGEQAALLLFSCSAEQRLKPEARKAHCLRDIQDYYDSQIGPSETSDGKAVTRLLMGDALTEQQAQEMWDIYDEKFDFLGEYHPISMQDTREEFFGLLRSPHTMIAATYTVGECGSAELVCFTYFIDDTGLLSWLNCTYIEETFRSLGDSAEAINVFTPGLVSIGVGRSYAALSIGLFARAGDEAGADVNIIFENTNLSKRYVPRIVNGALDSHSASMKIGSSKVEDEVKYRLWSIRP